VISRTEHTPGCYSQADQQAHRSENKTDRKVIIFQITTWIFMLILPDEISCIQISPLSTLESSFEVLNIKKFDGNIIVNAPCSKNAVVDVFFLLNEI